MADQEDAEFQRLLKNAFQDGALRRMARKAGVHGANRKERTMSIKLYGRWATESQTHSVKNWLCTLNIENPKLYQSKTSGTRATL